MLKNGGIMHHKRLANFCIIALSVFVCASHVKLKFMIKLLSLFVSHTVSWQKSRLVLSSQAHMFLHAVDDMPASEPSKKMGTNYLEANLKLGKTS